MMIAKAVDDREFGLGCLELLGCQTRQQFGVVETNSRDQTIAIPTTDGLLKLHTKGTLGVVEKLYSRSGRHGRGCWGRVNT